MLEFHSRSEKLTLQTSCFSPSLSRGLIFIFFFNFGLIHLAEESVSFDSSATMCLENNKLRSSVASINYDSLCFLVCRGT